jgi:hypothetical protein
MWRRNREIRRFLDREMERAEREAFAAERAASDELDREVAALARAKQGLAGLPSPPPPPDLVDKVMRVVAERPARGFRAWLQLGWFTRPAGALAAFAVLVAGAALGLHRAPPPLPPPPRVESVARPDGGTRFTLVAPAAREVQLAGEWSGWKPQPLARDTGGGWTLTVPLRPGDWRYAFIVDGAWVDDPRAETYRPDGFGGRNAVISL